MKVFITGATGYIGQRLANKLSGDGHTIHALVRNPKIAEGLLHKGIALFSGDICDIATIEKAMKGCTHVFHVAGLAKLWTKNRKDFYRVNVGGTLNVLRTASRFDVEKLVYTSSCGVFGNSMKFPLKEADPRMSNFDNDYDLSKHLSECAVKKFSGRGLPSVIVNPSRVYGPGAATFSNPITKMIMRCMDGKLVIVPATRKVIANYAFIEDVVRGHIGAMEYGRPGERYILGGDNHSYDDFIDILQSTVAYPRLIRLSPFALRLLGYLNILGHHFTGREPNLTPTVVKRITKNAALDCSKAISELQYVITPLKEGIAQTIQHIQNKRRCYENHSPLLQAPARDLENLLLLNAPGGK